jgi:hypothetical protein
MIRRTIVFAFFALQAAALPGCGSAAQNRAKEGVDLLNQCDMRGAHKAFEDAYGMDSNNADIALAFALSDLALMPEDPALEKLRPRFGFTKPFDSTWLWNKGGLLDLASQKTVQCNTLADLARTNIGHPSLAQNNPAPIIDTIDKTITFGDLRTAGAELAPRFDKVAHAFATAASSASDDGVKLKGGCGAGTLTLQKPELYALAAAFTFAEAGIQLAKVYDGSVRLWPIIANSSAGSAQMVVDDLNKAFFHVVDASAGGPARDLFKRGFDLALQSVAAARVVKKTPENAVIDWLAFPQDILTDAQTLAQGGRDAMDKPTAIPFLDPAVVVDGPSAFTNPVELAPLQPQAFTVSGSSVNFTFDPVKARLGARMTPDPFTSNASYTWSFADRVSKSSSAHDGWALQTFDPGKRFSTGFSCN